MADLNPIPFATLVTRMMREITQCNSVFNFPLKRCFIGSPNHDLSVHFHGNRASTPLGPAAGPHTQMAQNIVLSWLGGARVIELKTVQILDQLKIARPCIDMRTVGYNIEWSQELRLKQSADEYIKAMMLIEILKHVLQDQLTSGSTDTLFDMSLGYDLAGIQSGPIRDFITSMQSSCTHVNNFRHQIPQEYSFLRDIEFPLFITNSVTLSTFHGCPSTQIEHITEHLISEYGLDVVIKLNPTLLGRDQIDYYVHDVMGYHTIHIPNSAYNGELTWEESIDLVRSLSRYANAADLSFGIKLSNTLVVTHDGEYLPINESQKFLSGKPLHILAMRLVKQFRDVFGTDLPISFSAGIDKYNFKDAVALGLIPITVCTDLLQPGGYTRLPAFFKLLIKQMDAFGVSNISSLIERYSHSNDETPSIDDPTLHNTNQYIRRISSDQRYHASHTLKSPRKVSSHLELFDCLTCDICIDVCPNNAIFPLHIPEPTIPIHIIKMFDGKWSILDNGSINICKAHQIAIISDLCNECGNCDVFCPEQGEPYIFKPTLCMTEHAFNERSKDGDFCILNNKNSMVIRSRFEGTTYQLVIEDDSAIYSGDGFKIAYNTNNPAETFVAHAMSQQEVNFTYAHFMYLIQQCVMNPQEPNYINASQ